MKPLNWKGLWQEENSSDKPVKKKIKSYKKKSRQEGKKECSRQKQYLKE